MKYLIIALRFKIFMTILLGIIYSFTMTGISQVIFPVQANGDLKLIGQNFEKPEYFWSRPSAISYNPLPSGGSNLSQVASALKDVVEERKIRLKAAHPEQVIEPPQDLLFASASGLDPHISPEAAYYQMGRIAKVRNLQTGQVKALIDGMTDRRIFGILGERTVNILALNLALEKLSR